MTELDLRKSICEVGRRLYAKNLAMATDGNISVRLGPNRYLCTPSGVSKGYMAPNDLVVADAKGAKISGAGKVTSELYTHLAAYEERPDMNAVIHAHPPKAIAFTLAGISLAECILPEVVYSIGGVPTTEYATPATREGSEVIRGLIRQCDAVMLNRHGAVTVGVDVFDALFKMEKVEHAAETLLTAHLLGQVPKLTRDEVEKLYDVRKDYGVSGKAYQCATCDRMAGPPCDPTGGASDLDRVAQETLRVLGA